MKPFSIIITLLALLSCSTNELEQESGEQAVEISFTLSTRGETTRATRPLTSSDNWQRCTNVRIYTFRSETEDGPFTYYTMGQKKIAYTYVGEYEKDNWRPTDVWGDNREEGTEERHTLRLPVFLNPGYYKFLAIGRDDISETDISNRLMTLPMLSDRGTEMESVFLNITNTDMLQAPELFTGTAVEVDGAPTDLLHVGEHTAHTSATILLTRAVAGVLLYVENVPTHIGGTKVAAIGIEHISATKGVLALSQQRYPVQPSANDITQDAPVLRIPLSGMTEDNGRYVNTTLNTADIKSGHPNSLCLGAFVTPQAVTNEAAKTSLQFVYYDAGGNALKRQNIQIADSSEHPDEDSRHYSLQANHLYCLGQRDINNNIFNPIDLSVASNLTITVNANWADAHDLTTDNEEGGTIDSEINSTPVESDLSVDDTWQDPI